MTICLNRLVREHGGRTKQEPYLAFTKLLCVSVNLLTLWNA